MKINSTSKNQFFYSFQFNLPIQPKFIFLYDKILISKKIFHSFLPANINELKSLSLICLVLGFLFIIIFYISLFRDKYTNKMEMQIKIAESNISACKMTLNSLEIAQEALNQENLIVEDEIKRLKLKIRDKIRNLKNNLSLYEYIQDYKSKYMLRLKKELERKSEITDSKLKAALERHLAEINLKSTLKRFTQS